MTWDGTAIPRPTAEETLALIEASLDGDKADDIKTIPLVGKTDFADYMVIASGTSSRRIDAMTGHLLEKLKASGVRGAHAEGRETGDWVLIDAGDVVVHLFRPEVREYYALEKLWEADLVGESARESATA